MSTGEKIVLGNSHAIAGVTQPDGNTKYAPLEGDQETTIMFPPGLDIEDMIRETIGAMQMHMAPGERPDWIEAENRELLDALMTFYEMTDETKEPTDG